MTAIAQAVGPLLLAALVVWYVGGRLLRLVAVSCFLCAAGLLALGDVGSSAGVAGCGLVCWGVGQLLYRARRGHWRSARARLFGREIRGTSHYGGARPPA